MGSRDNWLAMNNDDMNRAIILTWSNRSDGGVVLSLYQREQLERIVGEMARAIRTEPERLDAAAAEREATIKRLTRELSDARSALREYGPKCHCGVLSPCIGAIDSDRVRRPLCDKCPAVYGDEMRRDREHADALRAASEST